MNEIASPPKRVGRYEILGRLGAGGMGEVFFARLRGPSGFERPVVIKRILPTFAQDERFRAMFLDEARVLARIRHQNVVQIHELAEDENVPFLVMEYLEGESAAKLMSRLRDEQKLVADCLCAHIASEVCAGLQAAHEARTVDGETRPVLHRDVSPANIFLTYQGEVKLIDFGIAAAPSEGEGRGAVVHGKIAYMSPEQCSGAALDARSDLYSLGVVLYELTTGVRLFRRKSDAESWNAVRNADIKPPSSLRPEYPPALEAIVLRALARDRRDRYQTAGEMRGDLIRVIHQLRAGEDLPAALRRVLSRLFSREIEVKRRFFVRASEEEIVEVPISSPVLTPSSGSSPGARASISASSSPLGLRPQNPLEQDEATSSPRSPGSLFDESGARNSSLGSRRVSLLEEALPEVWEHPRRRASLLIGLGAIAGIAAVFTVMLSTEPDTVLVDVGPNSRAPTLVGQGASSLAVPKEHAPSKAPAVPNSETEVSADVSAGASALAAGRVDLKISSTPSAAQVFVNGQASELTPFVFQAPKGDKLSIRVIKDGYEPQILEVAAEEARELSFNLRRAPDALGDRGQGSRRGDSPKAHEKSGTQKGNSSSSDRGDSNPAAGSLDRDRDRDRDRAREEEKAQDPSKKDKEPSDYRRFDDWKPTTPAGP